MEDLQFSTPPTSTEASDTAVTSSSSSSLSNSSQPLPAEQPFPPPLHPPPAPARPDTRLTWAPPVLTAASILLLLTLSFWRHHRRVTRKRALSADYNDMRLTGSHCRIAAPLCHTYSLSVTELAASIRTRGEIPMEEGGLEVSGGGGLFRGYEQQQQQQQQRGKERRRSSVVPAGCFVPPSRKFRRRTQEEAVLDMVATVHANFDPDTMGDLGPKVSHLLSWLTTHQAHQGPQEDVIPGTEDLLRKRSGDSPPPNVCRSSALFEEVLNEFDDVCELSKRSDNSREVTINEDGTLWNGERMAARNDRRERGYKTECPHLKTEDVACSICEDNQELNTENTRFRSSSTDDDTNGSEHPRRDVYNMESLVGALSTIIALQKLAKRSMSNTGCPNLGNLAALFAEVDAAEKAQPGHRSAATPRSPDTTDPGRQLPEAEPSPVFPPISYNRRLSHDWYNDEVDFVLPSAEADKPGYPFQTYTAQIHRRRMSMDCYNDEVDFSMDTVPCYRPNKAYADITETLSETTESDQGGGSGDVDEDIELLRYVLQKTATKGEKERRVNVSPRWISVMRAIMAQHRRKPSDTSSASEGQSNGESSVSAEAVGTMQVDAGNNEPMHSVDTLELGKQCGRHCVEDGVLRVGGNSECSYVLEVIDEFDPCESSLVRAQTDPSEKDSRDKKCRMDVATTREQLVHHGSITKQDSAESEGMLKSDEVCRTSHLPRERHASSIANKEQLVHHGSIIKQDSAESEGMLKNDEVCRTLQLPRETHASSIANKELQQESDLKPQREKTCPKHTVHADCCNSINSFGTTVAQDPDQCLMNSHREFNQSHRNTVRKSHPASARSYVKIGESDPKSDVLEPRSLDGDNVAVTNCHANAFSSRSQRTSQNERSLRRRVSETSLPIPKDHRKGLCVSASLPPENLKNFDIEGVACAAYLSGEFSIRGTAGSADENVKAGEADLADFDPDVSASNKQSYLENEVSRSSKSDSIYSVSLGMECVQKDAEYRPSYENRQHVHDCFGHRVDNENQFRYRNGMAPNPDSCTMYDRILRVSTCGEKAVALTTSTDFSSSHGMRQASRQRTEEEHDSEWDSCKTGSGVADRFPPSRPGLSTGGGDKQVLRRHSSPQESCTGRQFSEEEEDKAWVSRPTPGSSKRQSSRTLDPIDATMQPLSLSETGGGRERPEGESPNSCPSPYWMDRRNYQQTLV